MIWVYFSIFYKKWGRACLLGLRSTKDRRGPGHIGSGCNPEGNWEQENVLCGYSEENGLEGGQAGGPAARDQIAVYSLQTAGQLLLSAKRTKR